MGWFKKAVRKIFGGGSSSSSGTVAAAPTPAVSVAAPSASSNVESAVNTVTEPVNNKARGKKKLTIQNMGSGTGVNI